MTVNNVVYSRKYSHIKEKFLKKSRKISYMLSGWIEPKTLGIEEGGTACLTIGCSSEFHAVRIGFANKLKNPWTLNKVMGIASSGYNDFVNPIGNSSWVNFSSSTNSNHLNNVIECNNKSEKIIVKENPEIYSIHNDGNVFWTWTNWASISSLDPDPVTGMYVLMLRALVPSNQEICYAVGQMRSLINNIDINGGFEYFVGGLKFDIDRVNTQETKESTASWLDNQLAVGSIFPIVQFLTKDPGITGMVVGDSHQQGTSTTEQLTNFLYRTMTKYNKNKERLPFGIVNSAQGGLTSQIFFERMHHLLDSISPSFVVLPGWTYNDVHNGIHADEITVQAFFAQLLLAAEECNIRQILPIFTTPFPRNSTSMGEIQMKPWLWLHNQILSLQESGEIVIDSTEIFGKKDGNLFDGTYKIEFSTDLSHPNDSGHEEISKKLFSIINTLTFESDFYKETSHV